MKIKNAPTPQTPCNPNLPRSSIIPSFPRIPVLPMLPKLPKLPKELNPPIFPTPKAIIVVGTLTIILTLFHFIYLIFFKKSPNTSSVKTKKIGLSQLFKIFTTVN